MSHPSCRGTTIASGRRAVNAAWAGAARCERPGGSAVDAGLVGSEMCIRDSFIRVYKAFDGDLTAAIVLGTIGQHNFRRHYDELGTVSYTHLTLPTTPYV
jgi:hypothetical protein